MYKSASVSSPMNLQTIVFYMARGAACARGACAVFAHARHTRVEAVSQRVTVYLSAAHVNGAPNVCIFICSGNHHIGRPRSEARSAPSADLHALGDLSRRTCRWGLGAGGARETPRPPLLRGSERIAE